MEQITFMTGDKRIHYYMILLNKKNKLGRICSFKFVKMCAVYDISFIAQILPIGERFAFVT
jgi:hypothetical protein